MMRSPRTFIKTAAIVSLVLLNCVASGAGQQDTDRNKMEPAKADSARVQSLFAIEYDVVFLGSKVRLAVNSYRDGNVIFWDGNINSKGFLGELLRVDGQFQGQSLWNPEEYQVMPANFILKYFDAPSRNIAYHFDTRKTLVSITQHRNQVSNTQQLPIPSEVKDLFTIHLQLSIDAQRGKQIMQYELLSGKELKKYVFVVKGEETITHPLSTDSKLKALRLDRLKNDVVKAHYWISPDDHYLPIKVNLIRKGKVQTQIIAQKIQTSNNLLANNSVLKAANLPN